MAHDSANDPFDYNVFIVGGGIQGVGLLFDLATRRIPKLFLAEQALLASGTSSRSTKLVHGGLRYLEHVMQWKLVYEALHERTLLLKLLPGLVRPIPIVMPASVTGRPEWMLKVGVGLYQMFAGDCDLPHAQFLRNEKLFAVAPYLKNAKEMQEKASALLFYDGQMDDDVIVRLCAAAAQKHGATLEEETKILGVKQWQDGFEITLQKGNVTKEVTSRIVVNATGAWINRNLENWGFVPKTKVLLNVGSHILFSPQILPEQPRDCAGSLIQNEDGRAVFFLPWNDKWLLGTTETLLENDPGKCTPSAKDIEYLMRVAHEHLGIQNAEKFVHQTFAGVRTMPLLQKDAEKTGLSAMSREGLVDENVPGLLSICGGKYTTFRNQSEKLGGFISRRLGMGGPSGTLVKESWFLDELRKEKPEIFASNEQLRTFQTR